jgi:hypothetical protein
MAAPTGYIYCITNPTFKADHTYKLGYTGSEAPIDRVRKKLLQRYGTYFGTPECVGLLKVLTPALAERRLFQLLTEFNTQKEFFKADFETVIRPALERVGEEFFGEIVIPQNKSDHEQSRYECITCAYKCHKHSEWLRHINRPKHIVNTKPAEAPKKENTYPCKTCDKIYTCRSGLWHHKPKCNNQENIDEKVSNTKVQETINFPALFMEMYKCNTELQRQNQELQKTVLEICQKNMAKNSITIDVK